MFGKNFKSFQTNFDYKMNSMWNELEILKKKNK